MLRSVVGVNVGVVLVGTPLCSPSRDTSCNRRKSPVFQFGYIFELVFDFDIAG